MVLKLGVIVVYHTLDSALFVFQSNIWQVFSQFLGVDELVKVFLDHYQNCAILN